MIYFMTFAGALCGWTLLGLLSGERANLMRGLKAKLEAETPPPAPVESEEPIVVKAAGGDAKPVPHSPHSTPSPSKNQKK